MSPSQAGAAQTEIFDPLLAAVKCGFGAEFYPHGFPVAVTSNSPAILEAAHESWSGMVQRFSEKPLEIRCLVAPGGGGIPRVPSFRAKRHLLTAIADADHFWCADIRTGFAFGWLTTAAAQHSDYVRYQFLEAMAYSLLDNLHLFTIHAACVARNGRGLLLAGESGAGKSSLAYTCARRGWTFISDDASSLVRRAEDCIVLGNPRLFRFRATAGSLFPEFRGKRESRRANGKPTIEIETASLPSIRTETQSRISAVVFLTRPSGFRGSARFCAVTREGARGRLFRCPWPRELGTFAAHETALERLLRLRLVEIRYRDLDSAVDALERVIEES